MVVVVVRYGVVVDLLQRLQCKACGDGGSSKSIVHRCTTAAAGMQARDGMHGMRLRHRESSPPPQGSCIWIHAPLRLMLRLLGSGA